MTDIKSAHEIAMEKVAKLGEATEEERLRWKYVPEGEKLAASYLKQGLHEFEHGVGSFASQVEYLPVSFLAGTSL